MAARIDGKQIKKKLDQKADRKKTSLYLSEGLYKRFKKACGPHSPSEVIEEMMEAFIASLR